MDLRLGDRVRWVDTKPDGMTAIRTGTVMGIPKDRPDIVSVRSDWGRPIIVEMPRARLRDANPISQRAVRG